MIAGLKNADNITATFATVADINSILGTYPIVPTLNDPSLEARQLHSDFEERHIDRWFGHARR